MKEITQQIIPKMAEKIKTKVVKSKNNGPKRLKEPDPLIRKLVLKQPYDNDLKEKASKMMSLLVDKAKEICQLKNISKTENTIYDINSQLQVKDKVVNFLRDPKDSNIIYGLTGPDCDVILSLIMPYVKINESILARFKKALQDLSDYFDINELEDHKLTSILNGAEGYIVSLTNKNKFILQSSLYRRLGQYFVQSIFRNFIRKLTSDEVVTKMFKDLLNKERQKEKRFKKFDYLIFDHLYRTYGNEEKEIVQGVQQKTTKRDKMYRKISKTILNLKNSLKKDTVKNIKRLSINKQVYYGMLLTDVFDEGNVNTPERINVQKEIEAELVIDQLKNWLNKRRRSVDDAIRKATSLSSKDELVENQITNVDDESIKLENIKVDDELVKVENKINRESSALLRRSENKFILTKTVRNTSPLLYVGQKYPFGFMLVESDDFKGKEYKGTYTSSKHDINPLSYHRLNPKATRIALDIYEQRNNNFESLCLFVDYFYNIDTKDFIQMIEMLPDVQLDRVKFVQFMEDFGLENYEEMIKIIFVYQNMSKKNTELYVKQSKFAKLLQEIHTKKYIVADIIYHLYIYVNFDYYITMSTAKYTGRLFSVHTPLDITIKSVRCITDPYHIRKTDPRYSNRKKNRDYRLVAKLIRNEDASIYLKTINYRYKREHINNLIKNDRELIDKNLCELNIENITILIKKGISVYSAMRYLYSKKAMENNEPFTIEKDASNSGLQLLSLLLRSKSGATLCNLINPQHLEENKPTDVYTYIRDKFFEDMVKLADLNHKNWFILNKQLSLKDEATQERLKATFAEFVVYNQDKLSDRKTWKSIVMPQQYGITSYKIVEILMETLNVENNNHYDLFQQCSMITTWFYKIGLNYIPIISDYLNMFKETKRNMKRDKVFTFKSSSFQWNFKAFKLIPHKVKVNNQQFKFYYPSEEIDRTQMFRSLPPILIHGIDATIVHNMRYKTFHYNIALNTIHDCFLVPSDRLGLFLILLQNEYRHVYDSNYLYDFITKNNLDPSLLKIIRNQDDADYLDFEALCLHHYDFVK